MADSPAQLDYARSPGWRERKSLRRAAVASLIVFAVLGSLKFLGPAWTHVRMLRYQNRCLEHADPAGKSILKWDVPSDGPQRYTLGRTVVEWNQFYALFSPPGGRSAFTVFVHGLTRKDGARRLVAVDLFAPTQEMTSPRLDSTVIEPGGLFSRPQLRSTGSWYTPFRLPSEKRSLQVFAGQPDPANGSHFTIAFRYGDHRGTFDGWLQDDDGILFELREPLPSF